jgi:methyl-accepting chemotaxis protein
MNLSSLSIKWKILVPVVIIMLLSGILYTLISGSVTRKIVLQENKSKMEHLSETIFAIVTEYMRADNFQENKAKFLNHMNKTKTVSIAMIRSDKLDAQYGRKSDESYATTAEEKEVIQSGNPVYVVEKIKGEPYLRAIFPYRNVTDYMGISCVGCHMQGTEEGDILGALNIRIPLAGVEAALLKSRLIIAGVVAVLTILMVSTIFIALQTLLMRPLWAVMEVVRKASAKDFSKVLKINSKDEIGALAESVNAMSGELAGTMKNVRGISKDLLTSADTLKCAINESLGGTKQQAMQAGQIATASEEMSQTIAGIAQNGSKAASLSSATIEVAEDGSNILRESVVRIESAGQSAKELSLMIERLNVSVTEIGDIILVIKDIADQTNLLALNAAIEAARAGEQGRGFAVVADEVRKLAERTTKATGEISQRVAAVQEDSRQTANSMQTSLGCVNDSVGFTKRAQESLGQIVNSVQMASDEVAQIAAAVEEQSATASDITKNIEDISVIARTTEKSAENLSTVFEKLNGFSRSLLSISEEFRFLEKKSA